VFVRPNTGNPHDSTAPRPRDENVRWLSKCAALFVGTLTPESLHRADRVRRLGMMYLSQRRRARWKNVVVLANVLDLLESQTLAVISALLRGL
jgi:hypothetical protein